MRIKLSTRVAAAALADYLRRCECNVVFVNDCTLDVFLQGRSPSGHEEHLELDAYLRVWMAMHSEDHGVLLPG
jgi:hypothetical protein